MYEFQHSFLSPNSSYLQIARITDLNTDAMKVEMRGHDNFIECAVFVPAIATPPVRELVALVRDNVLHLRYLLIYFHTSPACYGATIKSRLIGNLIRSYGCSR